MNQVDELLAKYKEKNEELAKRLHALPNDAPGIRSLEVKLTPAGARVSCRLDRAPLDVIVRRLLGDSQVSFLYERAGPNGRVTAAFQDQPLILALNILLEPFDYQAIEINSVVVVRAIPIGWKPPKPITTAASSTAPAPSPAEKISPKEVSGSKSTAEVDSKGPPASPTTAQSPLAPFAGSLPPPPPAPPAASPSTEASPQASALPPPPPPPVTQTSSSPIAEKSAPSASPATALQGAAAAQQPSVLPPPPPPPAAPEAASQQKAAVPSASALSPSGAGGTSSNVTEPTSTASTSPEMVAAPTSPAATSTTPTASANDQSDLFAALDESSDTGTTYRVVTPLYVPADYILTNILTPLYPSGGSNTIQYGIVPETNQVFLYGPANEVARAVRIVRDADVEPVHIYFETALVSFTSEVSEVVASALQNLAYKQYSNVNVTPGFPQSSDATNAGTFSFLRDSLADNPLSFGALINSLVSINQARILSRPYLFTLNGKTASLTVGDQGYVQVKSSTSASGSTTSANPITIGTTLSLTPTALPDGTIRLSCDIKQSQLVPSSAQLDAETENAEAQTVLQVRDGESVLIGGLNSQESNLQSYGFPYLEKIPLLNFLFKSIYNNYFQEQIFIYITPRIWRPSLQGPVEPRPEVPFQGRLNILNRPYE